MKKKKCQRYLGKNSSKEIKISTSVKKCCEWVTLEIDKLGALYLWILYNKLTIDCKYIYI